MKEESYYNLITLMQNEVQTYINWVGIISAIVIIAITVINVWVFRSMVKQRIKKAKEEFKQQHTNQKNEFNILLENQRKEFIEIAEQQKTEYLNLFKQKEAEFIEVTESLMKINATNFVAIFLNFAKKAEEGGNLNEISFFYEAAEKMAYGNEELLEYIKKTKNPQT